MLHCSTIIKKLLETIAQRTVSYEKNSETSCWSDDVHSTMCIRNGPKSENEDVPRRAPTLPLESALVLRWNSSSASGRWGQQRTPPSKFGRSKDPIRVSQSRGQSLVNVEFRLCSEWSTSCKRKLPISNPKKSEQRSPTRKTGECLPPICRNPRRAEDPSLFSIGGAAGDPSPLMSNRERMTANRFGHRIRESSGWSEFPISSRRVSNWRNGIHVVTKDVFELRGGNISKTKLTSRFDEFSEGRWDVLISASEVCNIGLGEFSSGRQAFEELMWLLTLNGHWTRCGIQGTQNLFLSVYLIWMRRNSWQIWGVHDEVLSVHLRPVLDTLLKAEALAFCWVWEHWVFGARFAFWAEDGRGGFSVRRYWGHRARRVQARMKRFPGWRGTIETLRCCPWVEQTLEVVLSPVSRRLQFLLLSFPLLLRADGARPILATTEQG